MLHVSKFSMQQRIEERLIKPESESVKHSHLQGMQNTVCKGKIGDQVFLLGNLEQNIRLALPSAWSTPSA